MTAGELRRRQTAYRAAVARVETHRAARNAAVCDALAEGFTHRQIADATGLSRGRINQIRVNGRKD